MSHRFLMNGPFPKRPKRRHPAPKLRLDSSSAARYLSPPMLGVEPLRRYHAVTIRVEVGEYKPICHIERIQVPIYRDLPMKLPAKMRINDLTPRQLMMLLLSVKRPGLLTGRPTSKRSSTR